MMKAELIDLNIVVLRVHGVDLLLCLYFKVIERTWHALSPLLQHMGIDHRGGDVLVS